MRINRSPSLRCLLLQQLHHVRRYRFLLALLLLLLLISVSLLLLLLLIRGVLPSTELREPAMTA